MQKSLNLFKITPKTMARVFFFALISPAIYEESGIVTTIILGLLSIEIAIKGDWLNATHTLITEMTSTLTDIMEFQNDFIKRRLDKNANKD